MLARRTLLLLCLLGLSGCVRGEPVTAITFVITNGNNVFNEDDDALSRRLCAFFLHEVGNHWNAREVTVAPTGGEIVAITLVDDRIDGDQSHYIHGYGHTRTVGYRYAFRGAESVLACQVTNHAHGAFEHFFGASQEQDAPGQVLLPPDMDDILRQLARDIYQKLF
jgi:hypothetical protein